MIDRTDAELDIALDLVKSLPFFRQFPSSVLKNLCAALEYCRLPAGRVGEWAVCARQCLWTVAGRWR
jgi:hypothetical protein